MPPTPCLPRFRTLFATAMAAAASFGCAYPRTVHVYDEECQVMARQMVLDFAQINAGRGCGNNCISELVGQVAVLAASTVISGSIVVTGNVVYWFEKKRNCRPRPSPGVAPLPDEPA